MTLKPKQTLRVSDQHFSSYPISYQVWTSLPEDATARLWQGHLPGRWQRYPEGSHTVLPHKHEFYEIGIILSGRGTHVTDSYAAPLEDNTVYVVPPGSSHQLDDLRGVVMLNVLYLAEWVCQDLLQLWRYHALVSLFLSQGLFPHAHRDLPVPQFVLHESETAAVIRELWDIDGEYASGKSMMLFVRWSFLKLLHILSRAYVRQHDRAAVGAFRPEVLLVLKIVEEATRRGEMVRVAECAHRCGLSVRHLSRMFLEDTGQKLSVHAQHRRAQEVARMLLTTRDSITSIAFRLGFSDAAHLAKVFRRFYTLSPSAYREASGVADRA